MIDGVPVHATMATIPGREALAREAMESLLPQVDSLHIAFNYGPTSLPRWATDNERITYSEHDNSLGDAAKFVGALEHEGFVAICDDDIRYPSDYIAVMTHRAREHGAIVTIAGSNIPGRITSYYNGRKKVATAFTRRQTPKDTVVHIGATGGMVYHTDLITFPIAVFQQPNMADIWASIHAKRQGVPIVTIAKNRNWLHELQRDGRWSIYSTRDRHDHIQAAVVNQVDWNG